VEFNNEPVILHQFPQTSSTSRDVYYDNSDKKSVQGAGFAGANGRHLDSFNTIELDDSQECHTAQLTGNETTRSLECVLHGNALGSQVVVVN
jgi:hypothetical protein